MTWMYHKTTGEAKLFTSEEEVTEDYCDTPAKCGVEEAEVLDRNALKEEAKSLNIEFAKNIKTEDLAELIAKAKLPE